MIYTTRITLGGLLICTNCNKEKRHFAFNYVLPYQCKCEEPKSYIEVFKNITNKIHKLIKQLNSEELH